MRQAQKSNRSRGRGGRKNSSGGNNLNRVYDSAGPDGKVRGTPQQIIDKYTSLARDAQTAGDRVATENFLQHAEHYQRILISAMQVQEQARRENSQPQEAQPEAEDETATPPAAAASGRASMAIEGMATIDSGTGEADLLVETNEAAPAPPHSNGENRRRRRKPMGEPKPADGAGPATGEPEGAAADG